MIVVRDSRSTTAAAPRMSMPKTTHFPARRPGLTSLDQGAVPVSLAENLETLDKLPRLSPPARNRHASESGSPRHRFLPGEGDGSWPTHSEPKATSQRSKSRLSTVVLPTPEGPEMTTNRPRGNLP